MARRPKVYLAGPDVFLPDAAAIGERKKEVCKRFGLEGLFPFDNEISPTASSERVDLLIYRANVRMIRRSDAGIFNLTPFRGPSADVGTVFELGMFAALGKPVFGYTNRAGTYLNRVQQSGKVARDKSGAWRDALGLSIEDFENTDNLMIEAAFVEQAHPIIRHDVYGTNVIGDLAGFEECLRLAAKRLLKDGSSQQQRLAM